MKIVYPIVLIALLVSTNALAGESKETSGVKVIEAEGVSQFGEDTTKAQARAMALNNARRRALEEAVGVSVRASAVLYNTELISDLVHTATKGLIVKEETLEDIFEGGKDPVYKVRIRAHIKPIKLEKSEGLKVANAEVFKVTNPSFMKNPVFQDNDELQVKVRLGADAYLNLFSVDQDGRILKLLPNSYVKEEMLAAGKDFFFPDEELRKNVFKYIVRTPRNLSKAIESVLVIATKERVFFLAGKDQGETTVTDLMKELSELESPWAWGTVGYEVRK